MFCEPRHCLADNVNWTSNFSTCDNDEVKDIVGVEDEPRILRVHACCTSCGEDGVKTKEILSEVKNFCAPREVIPMTISAPA
jgi:hypothetical protein